MVKLNRFKARVLGILAAVAVAAILAASVYAAVPSVINYQGRLLDNSPQQNPVDATVSVEFSIWDSATGGASLWSETASVQVVKGLFNVLLGSQTPIPPSVFTAGATRYLEIHVSGETLSPRQRIAATPFASVAAAADDAGALGGVAAESYQRRIATPCPDGFSINAVGADGTTTCIQGAQGPQGPPGPPGPGLETGSITGKIVACSGPIGPGALTYVEGRSAVSYTASDGSYLLSYLPAGNHTVKLPSSAGSSRVNVTVNSGQTTDMGTYLTNNLAVEADNCGACGASCSSNHVQQRICQGGSCESGICSSGWLDCNGNKRSDGCEINPSGDLNNCGACGHVCSGNHMNVTCITGQCGGTCAPLYGDCDGDPSNGCERSFDTDILNCGNCNFQCSPNHVPVRSCQGGNCNGACETGFADCDGNKGTNGCETNINTSNTSCGSCGHACGAGTTCNSGVCS